MTLKMTIKVRKSLSFIQKYELASKEFLILNVLLRECEHQYILDQSESRIQKMDWFFHTHMMQKKKFEFYTKK